MKNDEDAVSAIVEWLEEVNPFDAAQQQKDPRSILEDEVNAEYGDWQSHVGLR